MRKRLLVGLTFLILSACTVGPDYTRPPVISPPVWTVSYDAAADLTVARRSLPATGSVTVNQDGLDLVSWDFDASNSGEDIRVTALLVAARGESSTNTGNLII